jgi:tartrate-resistant acid phosphatase type 5
MNQRQSRRSFLRQTMAFSASAYLAAGGIGCATADPGVAASAPAETGNVLIIGDWGLDTSIVGQTAVATAMIAYAQTNKLTPDCMFLLGDNFYGDLPDVLSPRWQTDYELMYPKANFPNLTYAIPGNHDYELTPSGNYKFDVELQYAAQGGTRFTMPGQSYTFGVPAAKPLVTVIALDSNVYSPLGPAPFANEYTMTEAQRQAQLTWLRAELAKPLTTPFLMVLGHHPTFSDGAQGDNATLISDWDGLFRQYNVHAYMAGHDHDLQHIEFAGHPTSFVYTGTGGAELQPLQFPPSYPAFLAETYGFIHMQVSPTLLTFRYLDSTGALLHAFTKTPGGLITVLV